ncbi:hypothetical protein BVIET440_50210 [Burkholderia vietnamiensis]|nr:hypothetical protein BVI1335_110070 [Burkholderia vietnamiensis]
MVKSALPPVVRMQAIATQLTLPTTAFVIER